jgi:hypothetical protein
MASVSNVYFGLKNLANKDQKGFITPTIFNQFAGIAQMNIFNRLLNDEMVLVNVRKARNIDAGRQESRLKQIREDLSFFSKTSTLSSNNAIFSKPDDLARIIGAKTFGTFILGQSTSTTIDLVFDEDKAEYILLSSISRPTDTNPIAVITETINVYPNTVRKIQLRYYKTPEGLNPTTGARVASFPKFGYVVNNAGIEQFLPSQSVDFELPEHYTPIIIMEIAKLIGVSINEADLYQVAKAEENKQI